jgi:hypothetical protein
MNIFFLDPSPIKSAEILMAKSPKRARKFVIEFVQACAVLCERYGLPLPRKIDGTPYKTALAKRFPKPLMEWLGESRNNMYWCHGMAMAIGGKTIMDNEQLIRELCSSLHWEAGNTPFPNYACSKAKGLDFRHIRDVHTAYKRYLQAQL